MTTSVAFDKSEKFSVRIIRLYQYLKNEKKEFVISKQILRCGTSISANLSESRRAQSWEDFLAKVYIALKESEETSHWLKLLKNTQFITQSQFDSIIGDCVEIQKMLMAKTKTMKRKKEPKL